MTVDFDYNYLWKQTYDGLDLIMEHFRHIHGYRFPRTISTGATNCRQHSVDSKDTIMTYYKAAMYEDCRINAYLDFDAIKQRNKSPLNTFSMSQYYRPRPDYLLIDLDRRSFKTDEQLVSTLQTTLANIDKNISGYPSARENTTVIWSGNGYHIHVQLEWEMALEDMPEFANFKNQDLATRFLRFAERELTEGKADQHHNPSIKSCLFRVPGTINSKAKAAGLDPIVRVVQRGSWTYTGIPQELAIGKVSNDFLIKFHSHLVQELIDDKVEKLKRRQKLAEGLFRNNNNNNNVSSLIWIDKLLQTPVEDNRKDLLYWVLAPYLITVRGLDYDIAYAILDAWLDKCAELRRLEPHRTSFRYRIRNCLDTAESQARRPIRFETFKEYYPDVYKALKLT
jgi:hypothetical protein